jgi:hypothetical protein
MVSAQRRRLAKADRGEPCIARTSPKLPTRVRSGLLAASHQTAGSVGLAPVLLFRNLPQSPRMHSHPEPRSTSAKPAVVSVR